MRYRTIVADPPWRYTTMLPAQHGRADIRIDKKDDRLTTARSATPYATLLIDEIAALPVEQLSADDAHLYLWTTNTHLRHAWKIIESWGFTYSTLLTWCKPPRGLVAAATFTICTEFVLFCRKGSLKAERRLDRSWFEWPRSSHSAKPEAFLDLVQSVSPGPYLELFARRQRLGWDTWGDEALEHVELA